MPRLTTYAFAELTVQLCQHFWKFPQLKKQNGKALVIGIVRELVRLP